MQIQVASIGIAMQEEEEEEKITNIITNIPLLCMVMITCCPPISNHSFGVVSTTKEFLPQYPEQDFSFI
jgi:hypothetical protein